MITAEVAAAYTQCKLKAYLLLTSGKNKTLHEYILVLEEETKKNRENYLSSVRINSQEAKQYSPEGMKPRWSLQNRPMVVRSKPANG